MSDQAEPEDAPRSSMGPVAIAAGFFAVFLVGLILVLATRDSANGNDTVSSPLLGELVPPVQGETFSGETFDIDEVSDRWVLVNFFASWCVPCQREHPELEEFAGRHPDDGLVVSIPFGDTEADARAFFAERGGDWPVVLDPTATQAVAFGVLRPPESYLVAPGGTVVAKWQGEITADGVDQLIASLLGRSDAS